VEMAVVGVVGTAEIRMGQMMGGDVTTTTSAPLARSAAIG